MDKSELRKRLRKAYIENETYPAGSKGWESFLLDRIAELEAIINDAPHETTCAVYDYSRCDCFKSKAEKAQ